MKTLAAVLVQTNEPLKLIELEIPTLKRGQVLLKMSYSGICRSQINEIKGFKGKDHYLPHTLGHEGSGIVLEIGEDVSKVAVGDHVIATWIKGEGIDSGGVVYPSGIGNVNSGPISTFMSHTIISENRLIPISKDISLKEAALYGCAIPTGAGIVFNDLQVKKGSSVAIFGVGGIGLSATMASFAKECTQIIAVDAEESKLETAKQMGATHTINASQEDVLQALHRITEGRGLDYAVEAAGVKRVMETAFKCVRDKGGTCIIAGNVPNGTQIECDPFDFIKGKKLIGSWGGGVKPDQDIPHFMKEFQEKKVNLAPMISHEYPLDQINEAIEIMDAKKAARVLIKF